MAVNFYDAPKQLLLLRPRAGVADGELNDDEVIAALDAEIVCVVDEIIFVCLAFGARRL